MALENVRVKAEPLDLPESIANEPPDGKEATEIVDLKVEISAESRVKEEPADTSSASPSEEDDERTWHVPVEVVLDTKDAVFAPGNAALPDFTQPSSLHQIDDGLSELRKKGLVCQVCTKIFANVSNVQRHMLTHTKAKYNCTECKRQFTGKQQLDKHLTRHKKTRYPCEQCNKTFKTTSNLMQHKRTHLEVKPYNCPSCDKSFAFKANLAKHQGKSRCKKPDDEPLVCHVCHKHFEKRFLLKSHLRRHDTDKPFECDECKMMFKHKSTLLRHIQMHRGIRPYVCPHCNKSFTHAALLKPHIRVHTGEKPYQCPMCKKTFSHKHNMQRHVMRHSKVKHLVCEICHKQFPKESRLKYHMKTHVNEKHFACNICPKRFSHKQNVIRHYMRKHPNAKYECKDTDASVALKVWDTMKSKYSDEPEEILS